MLLIIGCTRSHTHEYVDGKCTCGQKETKVYTVVFKDIDGNVIKSEEVEENQSATAPEVKDGFGYTFIGWDKEFSKVTSDLEVNAVYDLMEFTVKFFGFYGELLKTEKVLMKQSATAPEAPEVPYHEFSKWSMDFSSVEFNIEVRAQYVPKMETYEMSNVNYWLQELSKKYNRAKLNSLTFDKDLLPSEISKTEIIKPIQQARQDKIKDYDAIGHIVDLRQVEQILESKLKKLEAILKNVDRLSNKESVLKSLRTIKVELENIKQEISLYEDVIVDESTYITPDILDKEEEAYERRKRDSEIHIW